MQLPKVAGWLRAGVCSGLVCAIAAALVSFAWPDQYVSSALLRFRPRYVPEQQLEWRQVDLGLRLDSLSAEVLSKDSLERIIQSPGIDLYTRERRSSPMEDLLNPMRIQVRPEWVYGTATFRISFKYPYALKAQRLVRALVTALVASNERINRNQVQMDGEPLPAEILEIVDMPSLPERSAGPNRYVIAGIGLCAGFLLGLAGFATRRIWWRQALRMTAVALCGFAAAGGMTFLMPDDNFANLLARLPFAGLGAAAGVLAWAVLRGGRQVWRRPHYGWSALAGGAAGALLAGAIAFAIPPRYVSQGGLRIHAAARTTTSAEDALERFAEIRDEVFSRTSLSTLVLLPALDLYPGERKWRPLEEIIENMRANDLRIEHVFLAGEPFKTSIGQGPIPVVFISFVYPDRFKAQAVVREIVAKITEGNAEIEKRRNRGENRAGAIVMEVLDTSCLPVVEPLFPQLAATMAAAAGVGALLAWVLAFLRRRPRGQAATMLKMGAAGCAAGALLAGAVAFAIPARYVSTAVLRVRPGTGGKVTARHVVDYLSQESEVILSQSNLAELMQRSMLDLYRGERAHHPMEQVIDKMREDLRIKPLKSPGSKGQGVLVPILTGRARRPTAPFSIAFTYTDRFKAQAVVRELVSMFVDQQMKYVKETPGLELELADEAQLGVLDEASLPEAPVWPPRGGIIIGGLLAGLLLGLVAAVIRRSPGRSGVETAVSDPACARL